MVKTTQAKKTDPKKTKFCRLRPGMLVTQLIKILEKGENEGIRWRKDGWGFTIHDYKKFYNQTLQKYYPGWDKTKFTKNLYEYYFQWAEDEPDVSYKHRKFHRKKHSARLQSRSYRERKLQARAHNNKLKRRQQRKSKVESVTIKVSVNPKQNSKQYRNASSMPNSSKENQKDSQLKNSINKTIPFSLQPLKQKIFLSFATLRNECRTKKSEYFQNFLDINTIVEQIKNPQNPKNVIEKVNQMKVKIDYCCQIYRNLCKNVGDFQKNLEKLFNSNNPNGSSQINGVNHETPVKNQKNNFSNQKQINGSSIKKSNHENAKTSDLIQEVKILPNPTVQKSMVNESQKMFNFSNSIKKSEVINNSLGQNKQVNQQSNNKTNLLDPIQFLKKNLSIVEIPDRYKKILLNRNGTPLEFFVLNLDDRLFDMKEFLQYDWRNIHRLSLSNCKLSQQEWQQFSKNYQNFKNLRSLSLSSNNIAEITKGQIQKFPNLEGLNLGQYGLTCNPLSDRSRKEMIQLQMQRQNKLYILMHDPAEN